MFCLSEQNMLRQYIYECAILSLFITTTKFRIGSQTFEKSFMGKISKSSIKNIMNNKCSIFKVKIYLFEQKGGDESIILGH